MAVMDAVTVDERVAAEGDDAALLKAEGSKLNTNPDDGRAEGPSNFSNAERIDTSPVHVHCVQATAKTIG